MQILGLILLLLGGGALAAASERLHRNAPRWLALGVIAASGLYLLTIPVGTLEQAAWIPRFGISVILAMDGLSFAMVALTLFLGLIAIVSSWSEIDESPGFFQFNLLWTLAGVVGVFTALDLFLFFVFWEVMLVPMYFLIAIWGHEARAYAAMKFFLFTQISGLLMLFAILTLVYLHYDSSGVITFAYENLRGAEIDPTYAFLLMLGFFVAFVVKLPGVPFHTWLPDAHTQAPTAGSVILAGILLKTGAYGLLRFVVPLFPDAAEEFRWWAMFLGAASVIYGGYLAFSQSDFKRLVAYSSISHMGFVLLGVFAWNTVAVQGAVVQMVAHGFSTAALFMMAGALQQRLHTREDGPDGRPLAQGAAHGGGGPVLRRRLPGDAGARQLRRRVHGADRRLPSGCAAHHRRRHRHHRRGGLCAFADAALLSGRTQCGGGDHGRLRLSGTQRHDLDDGGLSLARHLSRNPAEPVRARGFRAGG